MKLQTKFENETLAGGLAPLNQTLAFKESIVACSPSGGRLFLLKNNHTNLASSSIGTAASALLTGQPALAPLAIS